MSVNRSYAQGVQGIIKACILLSLLLTLICASVWCVSYRIFFLIVSIVGFLIEFAYYLAYLLNLTDKLKIDWLKFVGQNISIFMFLGFIHISRTPLS